MDQDGKSPVETSLRMKVFVSYARADLDFVDQLVLALEDKGFDALLDRHNIDAAENWQERLSALITACDTMVFAVSAASTKSPICKWEIAEAITLGKRLIPVVPKALGQTAVPPELAALNFVHFYKDDAVPGSGFYDGVRKLERALKVDLAWIRLQTRLGEDAAEWRVTRGEDRLLRGAALEEALAWLQRTPPGHAVTDRVREFLRESEAAELVRRAEASQRLAEREETLRKLSRRTAAGLAGAAALTVLSGGLAWWGLDAERRFAAERERVAKAEEEARRKLIETQAARTDIQGQVVAYAAAPGQAAMDGLPGENSPFTRASTKALADADTSFLNALMQASLTVSENTKGSQRPYVSTNLNGDIYLLRPRAGQIRRALCVSVDALQGTTTTLANVARDAQAWSDVFSRAGFDVRLLNNPTNAELAAATEWVTNTLLEKQGLAPPRPLLHRAGIAVIPKDESEPPSTEPQATVPNDTVPKDAGKDMGPPPPPIQLAPFLGKANANVFSAVFYAGWGISSGGRDYVSTKDSSVDMQGNTSVVARVFPVDFLAKELERRAGLSALMLDTNFTDVDSIIQSETIDDGGSR